MRPPRPVRRRCADPLCARPLPAPLYIVLGPGGRASFCDLACLLEWAALWRVKLRHLAELTGAAREGAR